MNQQLRSRSTSQLAVIVIVVLVVGLSSNVLAAHGRIRWRNRPCEPCNKESAPPTRRQPQQAEASDGQRRSPQASDDVPSSLGLEGEWLSPVFRYAFHLRGTEGVATLANSDKFQAGQVMLRVDSQYGTSFSGKQLFTNGEFVGVTGRLLSRDELEVVGLGVTWKMVRVQPGALRPFQGEWFSPDHNYAFRINGSDGIATLSNSEKYRVGQTMIQICSGDGKTFYGRQRFTDGEYHSVSGNLNARGELEMEGSGAEWRMIKR